MKRNDRLELVKVIRGGAVLLLTIAYALLMYTGRDQQGLLGVIGVGLGYALRGRGDRTGYLQTHKAPNIRLGLV